MKTYIIKFHLTSLTFLMNIYAKINVAYQSYRLYGIYELIKSETDYIWWLSDPGNSPMFEFDRVHNSNNVSIIHFKKSDLHDKNLIKENLCNS